MTPFEGVHPGWIRATEILLRGLDALKAREAAKAVSMSESVESDRPDANTENATED